MSWIEAAIEQHAKRMAAKEIAKRLNCHADEIRVVDQQIWDVNPSYGVFRFKGHQRENRENREYVEYDLREVMRDYINNE